MPDTACCSHFFALWVGQMLLELSCNASNASLAPMKVRVAGLLVWRVLLLTCFTYMFTSFQISKSLCHCHLISQREMEVLCSLSC
jgi:hypothetical protein